MAELNKIVFKIRTVLSTYQSAKNSNNEKAIGKQLLSCLILKTLFTSVVGQNSHNFLK